MAEQNVVIKIQADVSRATSNVKALQQVIAKLSSSGAQAAAGTGKVSNAAKKTATASQLLDKEIKKVVAGQGDLNRVTELATAALEEQTAAAQRLSEVSKAVEGAVGKKGKQVLEGSGQVKGLADASGSASFALLSLGQASQDSAQFGMGFAQGLRAVNNNIQQTFTAIALGSIQAGGFGNLLSSMKGQLWGPGGLILGFSALSAAIEIYSTSQQRANKEADTFSKALESSASSIIAIQESESIEFSAQQLDLAIEGLQNRVNLTDQLANARERLAQVERAATGQAFAEGGQGLTEAQLEKRIQALDDISALRELGATDDASEIEANERVLEVLKQRRAELEAQLLIRQQLVEFAGAETALSSEELLAKQTEEVKKRNEFEVQLPPIKMEELKLMRQILELDEEFAKAVEKRKEMEEEILRARLEGIEKARSMAGSGEIEMLPDGVLDLGDPEEVQSGFERMADSAVRAGSIISQSFGSAGSALMQLAKTGEETDMRLFKMGKRVGIAQAIVNTAVGITRAFKDLPFPAAVAASVSIAASGAAQIAAIKAAKPSGSGGGGVSSAARGISSAPSFFTSFGNISDFPASNVASLSAGGAPGANISLVVQGRNLVGVIENEMQASSRRIGYSTGVFSGALASSSSTRNVFGGIK